LDRLRLRGDSNADSIDTNNANFNGSNGNANGNDDSVCNGPNRYRNYNYLPSHLSTQDTHSLCGSEQRCGGELELTDTINRFVYNSQINENSLRHRSSSEESESSENIMGKFI